MACRSTVLLLPAVPCGRMACVLFWFGRPRECESRGEIRGSAPKPPLRPRFSAEAQLLCDVSCGKKGGSAPSQFISQASSVRLGAKQPPCKMGAKQQPPPAVGTRDRPGFFRSQKKQKAFVLTSLCSGAKEAKSKQGHLIRHQVRKERQKLFLQVPGLPL
jgi:hypothetical protein